MNVRECIGKRCGSLIGSDYLACHDCWMLLPVEVRQDLSTLPPGRPEHDTALAEARAILARLPARYWRAR